MASGHDFDPENFERQSFELVRRGFEPLAVQRELQRAAGVVRDLHRQMESLERELRAVQSVEPEPLEARRVAEAVGAAATQVLDAAHAAATERAERAEREAEAVRAEAIAAADAIRVEANADREEILAEAAREAEAVAEDGRRRGRDMVNEAQVVRERMLGDLARKRQTGRAQVEQLRAGRDRLLESLSIAQASLDTAMKDLVDSVPEARSAAERAGIRIANEPTPTVEVMEAEIEAARLVGHPLVEGVPEPGVDDEPESPDPAFITAEMEALTLVDAALEADADEGDVPDLTVGETDATHDGDAGEPVDEINESEADSGSVFDQDGVDEPAELETDLETETETDPVVDVDVSDPPGDADLESSTEPDDADAELAMPADDIFARLREQQASDDDDAYVAPDDESISEPAPAAEVTSETDVSTATSDDEESPGADPDAELLERAMSTAVRAVKKVLVEEQGTLLDGIRRSGGDAIAVVLADEDAHAEPYESAAEPALIELAEALGGTGAVSTLEVGFEQIRAVALAPVRRRLLEVAEASDDADELSDSVRGLYRESRSRRLPSAIDAAVAAVRGAVAISTESGDLRWEVDPSGPCGPDCADNALAGAVSAGSPFPTGALHPPTEPGCTCRLVVV